MDEELSVIKIVAQPFSTAVFRGIERQSCRVLVDTVVLAALCVFLSCFEYYLASKVEGCALPHSLANTTSAALVLQCTLNSTLADFKLIRFRASDAIARVWSAFARFHSKCSFSCDSCRSLRRACAAFVRSASPL